MFRAAALLLVTLGLAACADESEPDPDPPTLVVAVWECSQRSCGVRGNESTFTQGSNGRARLTLRGFKQNCVWTGSWQGEDWVHADVQWERVRVAHRDKSRWTVVQDEETDAVATWSQGEGGGEMTLSWDPSGTWPSHFDEHQPVTHTWTLVRIATIPKPAAAAYLGVPSKN